MRTDDWLVRERRAMAWAKAHPKAAARIETDYNNALWRQRQAMLESRMDMRDRMGAA